MRLHTDLNEMGQDEEAAGASALGRVIEGQCWISCDESEGRDQWRGLNLGKSSLVLQQSSALFHNPD